MMRRVGGYHHDPHPHGGAVARSSSQRGLTQEGLDSPTPRNNLVHAACKRRRQQLHSHPSYYYSWVAALLAFSGFSLYLSTSVSTPSMILFDASSSSSSSATSSSASGFGPGSSWSSEGTALSSSFKSASSSLRRRRGSPVDATSRGLSVSAASTSERGTEIGTGPDPTPPQQQHRQQQRQQQERAKGASSFATGDANVGATTASPPARPAIAWLVSFPNSGTTYTLANAEHVTSFTTATNYAAECVGPVLEPLYPELSVSSRAHEDAPFLASPHLALPRKYILTKTHCTGYSDDRPWTYDLNDAMSFEEFCRFGFVPPRVVDGDRDDDDDDDDTDNATPHRCSESANDLAAAHHRRLRRRRDPKFYTSIDNVEKIVHLIRSPFDNLVARMHLGVSERRKRPASHRDDRWLSVMDDTPDGLRNWCEYVDRKFHKLDDGDINNNNNNRTNHADDAATVSRAVSKRNATLSPALLRRMGRVRCHSEIFRYVQFHNLVTAMAEDDTLLRLVSPPHVMYYEDYSTNVEATTAQMAQFLEQPMLRPAFPFLSGKTYGHLWTEDERDDVAALIHDLATPKTWSLLKRYFPGWKGDRKAIASSTSSAEERVAIEAYHDAVSPPASSTTMVWLMAYPATGPMFVLRNLVTASNLQILAATHSRPESRLQVVSAAEGPRYLTHKWKRVWPDHPEQSPFFFRTDATAEASMSGSKSGSAEAEGVRPRLVAVTKNQCDKFTCPGCPLPEDASKFERSCRIVPPTQPNSTVVPIDIARVRKVMVLVRNPFDVIRSRANRGLMQLAIEAAATNVTLTLPSNRSVIVTKERFSMVRDRRAALEMWCQKVDSQFQSIIATTTPVPLPPTDGNPVSWWDQALEKLNSLKRVVTCPSRWLASSSSERYSRLKQFKAVPDTQYTEFPVDRERLDEFRTLPCYSEWLRMVQWYNHVMEFSRPRRTLPRQILRFEDYSDSNATVRSKFDELAENLLGHPLESKVPERHFNDTRTRHAMLYTAKEARLAAALVRAFGSPEVWDVFQPYFATNETGSSEYT